MLLPMSALAGLSPLQVEAILAHELAHIRRHDYLVNLLQTLLETLLFYHPAVWWLSRQIRIEREHCCDDLAVSLCGDPVVYARALADLEELRGAVRSRFGGERRRAARSRAPSADGAGAARRPRAGLARGRERALLVLVIIGGAVGRQSLRADRRSIERVDGGHPAIDPRSLRRRERCCRVPGCRRSAGAATGRTPLARRRRPPSAHPQRSACRLL